MLGGGGGTEAEAEAEAGVYAGCRAEVRHCTRTRSAVSSSRTHTHRDLIHRLAQPSAATWSGANVRVRVRAGLGRRLESGCWLGRSWATAWAWPLFMSVARNVRPATMEHK